MAHKQIIQKSDFILTLGTMFLDENKNTKDSIVEAVSQNSAKFIYMHPIDNHELKDYYNQFIKYEVGSEEGICSLLLNAFAKNCDKQTNSYIDNLDIGYISAESSAGEEEFEEAYENYINAKNAVLLVGNDIKEHEKVESIVKLLALIKKYTNFQVIILDEKIEEEVNSCTNFDLEDIEELKSFNGTLIYKTIDEKQNDELISSQTFANIAKVANNDNVYININNQKIKRTLKVDKNLNGTIAILKTKNNDDIFNTYKFKQVKIEKVEA